MVFSSGSMGGSVVEVPQTIPLTNYRFPISWNTDAYFSLNGLSANASITLAQSVVPTGKSVKMALKLITKNVALVGAGAYVEVSLFKNGVVTNQLITFDNTDAEGDVKYDTDQISFTEGDLASIRYRAVNATSGQFTVVLTVFWQ